MHICHDCSISPDGVGLVRVVGHGQRRPAAHEPAVREEGERRGVGDLNVIIMSRVMSWRVMSRHVADLEAGPGGADQVVGGGYLGSWAWSCHAAVAGD